MDDKWEIEESECGNRIVLESRDREIKGVISAVFGNSEDDDEPFTVLYRLDMMYGNEELMLAFKSKKEKSYLFKDIREAMDSVESVIKEYHSEYLLTAEEKKKKKLMDDQKDLGRCVRNLASINVKQCPSCMSVVLCKHDQNSFVCWNCLAETKIAKEG